MLPSLKITQMKKHSQMRVLRRAVNVSESSAPCGLDSSDVLAYDLLAKGTVAVTRPIPHTSSIAERGDHRSLSLWERGTAKRWRGY